MIASLRRWPPSCVYKCTQSVLLVLVYMYDNDDTPRFNILSSFGVASVVAVLLPLRVMYAQLLHIVPASSSGLEG